MSAFLCKNMFAPQHSCWWHFHTSRSLWHLKQCKVSFMMQWSQWTGSVELEFTFEKTAKFSSLGHFHAFWTDLARTVEILRLRILFFGVGSKRPCISSEGSDQKSNPKLIMEKHILKWLLALLPASVLSLGLRPEPVSLLSLVDRSDMFVWTRWCWAMETHVSWKVLPRSYISVRAGTKENFVQKNL